LAAPLTVAAANLRVNTSAGNGPQFLSAAGTTALNVPNALNAGTGTITLTNGTFQIQSGAGGNAIYDCSSLTVNAPAVLDLNGNSEAIDALNGNGTITNGAAATSVTPTLGSCGGSGTFAGVIQNGNGTLGLTKVGAGPQTLSGTVAYSGATAVNAGTLVFTSSSALASLPTVTVAAGTVLCLNTAG